MQNNNVTTVKGNYNSNQNQMNRQQGIKGQNNINPNTQTNNIPQGNNMQNNIDFTRVPVVTTVNNLIVTAVNLGASDMHFDPTEDGIIVRFRIDGLLRNYVSLPQEIKQNVITRIKIMAGMNITETRLPQDGAIKDKLNGKDLDLRVSALPTKRGEKIVIRIMDYSMSLKGIEYLYFNETNYNKILKMLNFPNGIILVTGATGTGKSTTTYSMLQELNTEDRNIITVEDPVEMNIEGINQVQVNSEIGLTFASALRSILRQDPNIILIGEIRDSETAQIAVRAAITGHLVLSTIHTNNSLSTIERLLDMNVERYLLSTSLNGIISQKLARTLCPDCKKLRPTTNYEKQLFKRIIGKDVEQVYEPVGCEKCNGGFRGRIALQEVLVITDRLREIITDESLDKEVLRQEVYGGDTTTLLQDALLKVVEGYTTFKEVYKAVDIDFDLEKKIRAETKELEKEENKDENLEVIDAYDGVISDLKNMISDIKDIKTKAKENAKNKYKKKIDNTKFDLIDAFDGPDGAALKEKLEEKIIRENSKMNNNRNIKRPGK